MECNDIIKCMNTPSFECRMNGTLNGRCECILPKMWDFTAMACDSCVNGYTQNGKGAPCCL